MTPSSSTMLSYALLHARKRGHKIIASRRTIGSVRRQFWHSPTTYDVQSGWKKRRGDGKGRISGAPMLLATRYGNVRDVPYTHIRPGAIYFRGLMQTGCARVTPVRLTAAGQPRCIHEVITCSDKNNRSYACIRGSR